MRIVRQLSRGRREQRRYNGVSEREGEREQRTQNDEKNERVNGALKQESLDWVR